MLHHQRALLLALLVGAALLASCGDDGADGAVGDSRVSQTSSDAELALYFSEIEAAKAEHDALLPTPLTVAAAAEAASLPSPQEQIDFLINNLTQDNVAITGMLALLEGIAVPPELASEHREVLRTLNARFTFQETMIEQFRVGLRESMLQIARREGDIREHGGALCVVQSEAAHYGVEIDLGCNIEDVLKLRRTDRTTELLVTGDAGCNQQPIDGPAIELATFIDFLNRRAETVNIYQVTPEGERVFLLSLDPGEEHVQFTYFETRWLVTDQDDQCIGGYTARDIGTNLAIGSLIPDN